MIIRNHQKSSPREILTMIRIEHEKWSGRSWCRRRREWSKRFQISPKSLSLPSYLSSSLSSSSFHLHVPLQKVSDLAQKLGIAILIIFIILSSSFHLHVHFQKVSDLAQKLGIARNEVVAAQVGLLLDRKSINFEA